MISFDKGVPETANTAATLFLNLLGRLIDALLEQSRRLGRAFESPLLLDLVDDGTAVAEGLCYGFKACLGGQLVTELDMHTYIDLLLTHVDAHLCFGWQTHVYSSRHRHSVVTWRLVRRCASWLVGSMLAAARAGQRTWAVVRLPWRP